VSDSARAGCLPRIGGALALDFCNTTTGRGTERFVEHLFDHEDLLRWSVFNELLTPEAAAASGARTSPDERAAAFARAMHLRGLLNRVFDGLAAHRAPVEAWALAELTALAKQAWRTAELTPTGVGYAWRFASADSGPAALLEPIVRSAVEVLTTRDLTRLKACPGPYCGWVFLDATKNAGRVWCEMEVCGTRAKLRKRTLARQAARAER